MTQEAEISLKPAWANSSRDPISKNPLQKRAGGVDQVVERLHNKHKALSSNQKTTIKKDPLSPQKSSECSKSLSRKQEELELKGLGLKSLCAHPVQGEFSYIKHFAFFFVLQEADLDAELENCHHYMQFAAAAYGWPLYIYRNPFTGLCRIGGDW
jgi:hypothetical protein